MGRLTKAKIDKITNLRGEGYTQKEVAEKVDVDIKTVRKYHSNDIPEIIAMPIIGGNQDYLEWIDNEVI